MTPGKVAIKRLLFGQVNHISI